MGDITAIPLSIKRQHVGEAKSDSSIKYNREDTAGTPERERERRHSIELLRHLHPNNDKHRERRRGRTFAISPSLSRHRDCKEDDPRRPSLVDFQHLLKDGLHTGATPRGEAALDQMRVGVFETQGSRQGMEDRHHVCLPPNNPEAGCGDPCSNEHQHAFFAIYDGHGGTACADFVHDHLYEYLRTNSHLKTNPRLALQESLEMIEKEYANYSRQQNLDGLIGTTALVALIQDGVLTLGSIGDSEAILCRNAKPVKLTYPHTLENTAEFTRVVSTGGQFQNGRLSHPVWNPNLIHIGVTRAIGDIYFKDAEFTSGKESGLIATPDITQVTLTCEDSFVFLASDGYWDVVTPQETVAFVMNRGDHNPDDTCRQLTLMAMARASTDNITTLLIKLNKCEVEN